MIAITNSILRRAIYVYMRNIMEENYFKELEITVTIKQKAGDKTVSSSERLVFPDKTKAEELLSEINTYIQSMSDIQIKQVQKEIDLQAQA